jgi:hypothetical protein
MSNASVSKGNKRYPATIINIEMITGSEDAWQPFSVVLSSELGEMRLRKTRTLTSSPIGMMNPWDLNIGPIPWAHAGLAFEESVFWDCNGEEAIGWSERSYIHKPFVI